eukprot:TRINITY_DN19473_c0_g1_i1.p1 TRINITY_DN19473_c0_g1~~TRINITY_DN19473_c0_g1_i1.p1  ORF type:complete len:173 (+),score=18.03 TRINITY_DN19473_c0_g1_i1:148-666(+)
MRSAVWLPSKRVEPTKRMPLSLSFSSGVQRRYSSRPARSVAEAVYRVELTASFLERLDAIEVFLAEAEASFAFDALLAELRATVIPNLARFPRIGRRYLDNPPQSAEALAQLAALPAGAASVLREYPHGDYLMVYAPLDTDATVYLLSIRHHRQLSFDFARLWPGATAPDQR